jgi:hypothetical protein
MLTNDLHIEGARKLRKQSRGEKGQQISGKSPE